MRKLITVLLCIFMICNMVGYASVVQTENTNTVVLSGNDNSTEGHGKKVTVDVYAPEKNYADFTGSETLQQRLDILVYRNQGVTDEEGEYEFSFDINATGGEYSAVVFCENWNEPKTETFRFVNPTEAQTKIAALNDIVKEALPGTPEVTIISDIKTFISTNKDELGFVSDCDALADNDRIAEFIYDEIKEAPLDEVDYEKTIDLYKEYAIISSIDNNAFSNIFNYESDILSEGTGLDEVYNAWFIIEDIQTQITADLKNKNFESPETFYDAFKTAFVLRVTDEERIGVADLKKVYQKLETFIGIDADSQAGYNNIERKLYTSIETLKEAFNTTTAINPPLGGFDGPSTTFRDVTFTPSENQETTTLVKVFADLDDVEWAKEYIYKLVEKNIVNGVSETEFAPKNNVTREEFTKMIVNAFLDNPEVADIKFVDVNKNMWYYDYIAKAYNYGIIKGVSDDTFGVGRPITRQDMATIAYRAYLIKNKNIDYSTVQKFVDDNMMNSYAKEAVYAMKKLGIISGIDNANFAPLDYATRAEAAKIIAMLISL